MAGKRTRTMKKQADRPSTTENEPREDIINDAMTETTFDNETAAETNDVMTETARCDGINFKLKKKKTSQVWEHYTELVVEEEEEGIVIKKKVAECNYCYDVFVSDSKNGTSRLWNHYRSFHEESDSRNRKRGRDSFDDWKYDEESSLKKYHLAIIMHEYPFNYCEHEYTNDFIRSLCPKFPIKSRKTARARIMDIFHHEKKQLFDYFATQKCRFSCTMDVWTSNQNKGYLCVTGHFIDEDWNIQKRIINFMYLGGRHNGENLSVAYMQNMGSWNIDHKLFALTLDNAASNNVCVDTVTSTLRENDSLLCGGKFFHVRCAAHILNLVARDGVSKISKFIENIRALVLIVKSSPLQEEIFKKEAAALGITDRCLSLDVSTRWNSTYLMLVDALHFKRVFQRLILLYPDKYGAYSPAREEWDKAATICNCLNFFYDTTNILSGSHYPTANLFFSEFCEINLKIMEWQKSREAFVVDMAKSMKEKFDKYWKMSNVALAVACFLDPRYKMKVVEFYYSEMSNDYGFDDMYEFKKTLNGLYESYASLCETPPATICTQRSYARTSQCHVDLNEEPKKRRLATFLKDHTDLEQDRSDLEQYCHEPLLSWNQGDYFDILSWWKTHGAKYPILARLARDVLAIPATTVASESAFSSGGRVVDKYRSRLQPEVVEALICTKDWVKASRKDQGDVSSILDDLYCVKDVIQSEDLCNAPEDLDHTLNVAAD